MSPGRLGHGGRAQGLMKMTASLQVTADGRSSDSLLLHSWNQSICVCVWGGVVRTLSFKTTPLPCFRGWCLPLINVLALFKQQAFPKHEIHAYAESRSTAANPLVLSAKHAMPKHNCDREVIRAPKRPSASVWTIFFNLRPADRGHRGVTERDR